MRTLANIYNPITATPFQNDEIYCEVAPCEALKPFVRCFWGTKKPVIANSHELSYSLVIPDTCMDVLIKTDYTNNTYKDSFCNLDEHSFVFSSMGNTALTATFGIRFYAWSAIIFSERDFKSGKFFSVEEFSKDLKTELEPILFDIPTLWEKIEFAERVLLKRMNSYRVDNNLLNSIYYIIDNCGRAKISEVCRYSVISEKQLERIFNYNMGISPKTFSSLIRYQLLWQDMILSPNYNALDSVDKYGYTDQAHLINDFKKRHLMSPKEAIKYAMSDFYNTNRL
ncbi:MAG: helix-turn-helix domain-containing protein [Candidatus Fimenecus sp.]